MASLFFATTDAASEEDQAMALHEKHRQWIEARGISADLAEKMGLFTCQKDGSAWLAVPYLERGRVVNHKYRKVSEKRHQMDAGAKLVLWNQDCLLEQSTKPVVICEGEWDAMVALSLGFRAVSVPNGAPSSETDDPANATRYEFLWNAQELLTQDRVEKFILATDGDAPGQALRADLVTMLGADRCSFVEYPDGCKDLNEVLLAHGIEAVSTVLVQARPMPVAGLYRLSDFPVQPEVPKHPLQIGGLDDLFGLVPGTLTVMTGWPGHGKTSLLMKMIANLMAGNADLGIAPVNVAVGSFETIPRPILERRLKASMLEMPEHHPQVYRTGLTDEILAKRLSVIANNPSMNDDGDLDLERILDLADIAVRRDGVKLLVLDPWNEIEHKRRGDESETEYVGRAIRMLKRFAMNRDCAVWMVAHPRKPSSDGTPKPPSLYDLAGSAHFANKADFGFVVHRDNLEGSEIAVKIVKVRMGLPGRLGRVDLSFDANRSRYDLSPFSPELVSVAG
jgi:twinkle protein